MTMPNLRLRSLTILMLIVSPTIAASPMDQLNLIDPDNGGHLAAASSNDWKSAIDGRSMPRQVTNGIGKVAVFGFRDGRVATFDTFTMLINGTERMNVKDFELQAGFDSPTGEFFPIGRFQTQNIKLFDTPYQEFRFPSTTARFLKVKILSTHGWMHPVINEFQLFGRLQSDDQP